MKRAAALILTIVLLFSLASCGKDSGENTATKSDATATDTDKADNMPSFREGTEDLAIATSIAMRFLDSEEYLDHATCINEVLGWYCARKSLAGGHDYLTESETMSIQHAIRPENDAFDLNSSVKAGVIEKGVKGNDVVYYFPLYVKNYQDYFGSLEITAEYPENYDGVLEQDAEARSMITVNITDPENDTSEDYKYLFIKSDTASPAFPYLLRHIELPEVKGASEWGSDFKLENLIEANKLSVLLDNYKSVMTKRNYSVGGGNEYYYYRWNGHIVSNGYQMDPDGGKEFYFSYENYALTYSDAHYIAEIYCGDPETVNGENNGNALEKDISFLFDIGQIYDVREKGDLYTFRIRNYYADNDEYSSYYEVKKSDLSLQKAVWNEGGEYETNLEVNYGGEVDTYDFTMGWDEHPMRKVNVISHLGTENGEVDGAFTVEVPYNIEVVPFGYSDYNLWANDEMTKEYKYPGDGIDYTVCYTNIMG